VVEAAEVEEHASVARGLRLVVPVATADLVVTVVTVEVEM
jgi:hypothetical protein